MNDDKNMKNELEIKSSKELDNFGKDDFQSQFEASLENIPQFSIGDQVTGEIIDITDSFIFVSIGGKRDAYAEKKDYLDSKGELNYKNGDQITGYIVKHTDSEIVIARSIASANRIILRNAFEEKIPVVGVVTSPVKGGYSVSISGIRAFCPISQMDMKIVSNSKIYAGKSFDFIITELSSDNRNIVVSRRKLLEKDIEEQKKLILEKLKLGSVVKGKVIRLTNFGAFVDLGGIDGLLHISEMSWVHIESPSDVLNIGAEVEVKIIKMIKDKISLSMKALMDDPYEKYLEEIHEGEIVNCRVLRNLKFGSFVEIQKGIEGLIPISEMALGRHINHPNEVLKIGDVVEAQIMRINADKKEISLSLKALQQDPWDKIEDIADEGDVLTGIIENLAEFGIFVRLRDKVTGLLPKSKIKFLPVKLTKENIGEEIKVRVTQVDTARKRISLEPSDMPDTAPESKDDWKKYKKQKNKKIDNDNYDPDNPFLVL